LRKGGDMADTLSIYFPKREDRAKTLRELKRLAKRHDRSINYVVLRAIKEFLETEEMSS
jgi:predicted transcriptional regulator